MFLDLIAAVTDDDHQVGRDQFGGGTEYEIKNRQSRYRMEHLGQGRAHPLSFARGKNHDGGRAKVGH